MNKKNLYYLICFVLIGQFSSCAVWHNYSYSNKLNDFIKIGDWKLDHFSFEGNTGLNEIKKTDILNAWVMLYFKNEKQSANKVFYNEFPHIDTLFIESIQTGSLLSKSYFKDDYGQFEFKKGTYLSSNNGEQSISFRHFRKDSILFEIHNVKTNRRESKYYKYPEQRTKDSKNSLLFNDLFDLLPEPDAISYHLSFTDVTIPAKYKKVRVRFTVDMYNYFTGKVVKSRSYTQIFELRESTHSAIGD